MKLRKNWFLSLIAILAIFSIVSCGGNELPSVPDEGGDGNTSTTVVTDNLDAWREACNALGEEKEAKLDIQVTGTVTTVWSNTEKGKYNTYMTDEKGGSLLINGKLSQDVKPGDKVTVKIKKVELYQGAFEADAKELEIVNVVEGTPIAPTKITTQADFMNYGTGYALDYVTFNARVISSGYNYSVIIIDSLPENGDLSIFNNFDLSKVDEGETVQIHPNVDYDYSTGDVITVYGQMASYNGTIQLQGYDSKLVHKLPETFKDATFEDYQAGSKKAKNTPFIPSLDIKGVVASVNSKGMALLAYDKNGQYSADTAIAYEGTVPETVKPGQIITVRTRNANFNGKMAQCENFEIIKTETTTVEIADIQAKARTTYDYFDADDKNDTASNIWAAINNHNHGSSEYRDYVKVRGTFEKLEKREDVINGFWMTFEKGGHIYIVDPNTTAQKNDIIEVYGLLGTNKSGSTCRVNYPVWKKVDTYVPPVEPAVNINYTVGDIPTNKFTEDLTLANYISTVNTNIAKIQEMTTNKGKWTETVNDEVVLHNSVTFPTEEGKQTITGIVIAENGNDVYIQAPEGIVALREMKKGTKTFKLGDKITLTATDIAVYYGKIQIKKPTLVSVVSPSEEIGRNAYAREFDIANDLKYDKNNLVGNLALCKITATVGTKPTTDSKTLKVTVGKETIYLKCASPEMALDIYNQHKDKETEFFVPKSYNDNKIQFEVLNLEQVKTPASK